jgi:hypothetical protein
MDVATTKTLKPGSSWNRYNPLITRLLFNHDGMEEIYKLKSLDYTTKSYERSLT